LSDSIFMQRIILIGAQWLNRPSTIFFMMKHTVSRTLHSYNIWHLLLLMLHIQTYCSDDWTTKHANITNSFTKSYPCNRPWRPIGLWDIEDPTFSRQSAHRWRWGCQPHWPEILYSQEDSWYSFLLKCWVDPRAIVWLEGLGQLKNPMTSLGIRPATFWLVA
jgi:hypothetical protein